MKKVVLITLEYPPQKGGVASYYFGFVQELRRQGYEVEVVSNAPSLHPSPFGRGGLLLSRWFWPRWLKGYFKVRHTLKTTKYDLLFVGHLLPLGTIAYMLRRRVPYIVFTHGMDVLMAQKSWRKRRLMRKILQHAKLVVANSEYTAKMVLTIFGDRQKSLIPDVAVAYPCPTIQSDAGQEEVDALRRRLGLTGKKVLLTLGRVVERKGHDMVIKAMPEILKHVPEAVYVVAGAGPDLGRLQVIVSSPRKRGSSEYKDIVDSRLRGNDKVSGELQSSVRFVGAVSEEEKPLYYALCDLFVMPSRQIGPDVEGFGLSFLEAAVFGKPSVGGRSGGIPEAILDGKTGALVDPSDPAALARVVVQLLRDDGLRAELGQNAKARVVHEFRWEKQVTALIQALSSPT